MDLQVWQTLKTTKYCSMPFGADKPRYNFSDIFIEGTIHHSVEAPHYQLERVKGIEPS